MTLIIFRSFDDDVKKNKRELHPTEKEKFLIMTIKLDIKVGSSIDDSVSVDYVDGTPTSIKNDNVDGEMLVLLKDKENDHNTYFSNENNKSMTWSIQFRGFLNDENENADDIVFGNQWTYPIRDRLPWGTSVAVKFIK